MNWNYLDKIDKNLLYTYAAKLGTTSHLQGLYVPIFTGDADRDEMLNAEAKCRSAYYLIWFVYRYVLNCKTLEEAEQQATTEVLKKYKLKSLFERNQNRLYIGAYGINEIYLYNLNGGDLNIVLEILYNRYNYFEQLECFVRRTEGTSRSCRFRCMRAIEQTYEMIKNSPALEKQFKKYEEQEKNIW